MWENSAFPILTMNIHDDSALLKDAVDAGSPPDQKLIDLGALLRPGWQRFALGPLLTFTGKLLGCEGCNSVYRLVCEDAAAGREGNFFEHTLRHLGVRYTVSPEDLARIPRQGPLLVTANHPYGGVDGIVLGALLLTVRPDVRMLVNHLLNRIGPMSPWNVAVDPFGGEGAARANIGPMKECFRWLREGGVIAGFPAGEVSHFHFSKRGVVDGKWTDHFAILARRLKVPVTPVYFSGRNSGFFVGAGLLHPRLRTVLLPEELMRMRNRVIEVRIGEVISPTQLAGFAEERDCTSFLRLKTYVLGNRQNVEQPLKPVTKIPRRHFRWWAGASPVARSMVALDEAVDPAQLAGEIAALPSADRLVDNGNFAVFCTRAEVIPQVLREIGRLRELTFREVGEGTGAASDLDAYDPHYRHLFMWHPERRAIVGAYRIGLVDELLAARGVSGLYTSTLFRFAHGFLEGLAPSLELGRSFIAPEYQRKHASLVMIWRGIGEFIARHPRYRMLFGPVSISSDYHDLSKDLIIRYLRNHHQSPALARAVTPRKPPRGRGHFRGIDRQSLARGLKNIDIVSALVSELEKDRRGVPTLLKHYLKLNGTVLGLNVDPAFSNVVDGLLLVDLLTTDRSLLKRYLGEKGVETFLDYHHHQPKEKVDGERVC